MSDIKRRGWAFPIEIDEKTGKVKEIDDKDMIKQSIIMILSTEIGDRKMLPEYGCALRQFMFEPITYTLLKRIEKEVDRAIRKWESDINGISVAANQNYSDGNRVEIVIEYFIEGDANPQSISIPLSLNDGKIIF